MNFSGDSATIEEMIAHLSKYVTENKLNRIDQILEQRTRFITIVLENIRQVNNIDAALRSIECFGLQDVHIIEEYYKHSGNSGINKGASFWLTFYRYRSTIDCYDALRKQGYLIVAASPYPINAYEAVYMLQDIPLDQRIALVFGTEETGLSSYARERADACVSIPMYGFTGSLNISVSVAVSVYDIVCRLRNLKKIWSLSCNEKLKIKADWLYRLVHER
jgi:tRNA (guanosine-2'-O-)-methyltransferase